MMNTIFTLGHSNHSTTTFLGLLAAHDLQVVVDVRSAPYSRHVPHFNKRDLAALLERNGYRYLFMGDCIGGKPDDPAFLDGAGHVDYGKIAATERFQKGIDRLLDGLARGWRITLLCAEEDPARCHRQWLIARELEQNRNIPVLHIRADGSLIPAGELFKSCPAQLRLF